MRSNIIRWCQACLVCASWQVGQRIRPPLTPIPVAGPFDRVGVDVLHFPKSAAGNQYAVVFVDYLTKWPEVFATSDQTALTIAKLLVEEVVSRHGVLAELLSDRGKSFLSLLMQEVCSVLGAKKVTPPPTIPRQMVWLSVSTVPLLICWRRGWKRGDQIGISTFLTFSLCIKPVFRSRRKNLLSFCFMVEIPDCRLYWSWSLLSLGGKFVWIPTKGSLCQAEAWSMAQKQVQKAQKSLKKQYDKNTKEPDLKVGERVFVYMPKEKATKAYKFARPFHGPVEAGVVVRPVDIWRGESIRVAVNRVRRCPEAVPEGESWPARKSGK